VSIFKSIGSKLKRVVSLNNIKRAVTGNFTAIGADVVRVATTLSPAEQRAKDAGQSNTEQAFSVAPLSAEVNTFLDAKGEQYKSAVAGKISQNPTFQGLTDILAKAGVQTMWVKYRNWIIGAVVSIILFIVGWKILKKGKNVTRARKTR
jgi:hypothetical protein